MLLTDRFTFLSFATFATYLLSVQGSAEVHEIKEGHAVRLTIEETAG